MGQEILLFKKIQPIKLLHRNPKRGYTEPRGYHVTSCMYWFHLMMYFTNGHEFSKFQRKVFAIKYGVPYTPGVNGSIHFLCTFTFSTRDKQLPIMLPTKDRYFIYITLLVSF